ncbi:sensor histidine kinase [Microbacterium ureisolvens]|uniref:GAF domain-containing protein n=2 Tax=Microbacterium TaxID=33882 RepID=A0ABS7I2N6_9MICO|nr:GAF domain-containing protein [Microbacterium ureisolvens]MBW9111937.1 GAF domain-containing protein [Microbacterium ureisolvens]
MTITAVPAGEDAIHTPTLTGKANPTTSPIATMRIHRPKPTRSGNGASMFISPTPALSCMPAVFGVEVDIATPFPRHIRPPCRCVRRTESPVDLVRRRTTSYCGLGAEGKAIMTEIDQLSFPDGPRLDLDEALATLVVQAERVRTAQAGLRALLSATQAVVEESDLAAVLRRIAEAATNLVDAQYGALGVIAPERDALEEFIYVGLTPMEAAKIGDLPTGHGLLGALIADPRPIRLPNMSADTRAAGFPDHHPHMESFLGVPVRVRGEVFGNLYLTNRRDGLFTEEDERLVEALATTAGFAVENARLLDQARTRERWMGAAAGLSAALLSSSTTTAFDLIASRVFEVPGIDKVVVLLKDDARSELQVAAARGSDESQLRGAVIDPQATYAGEFGVAGETTAHSRSPAASPDPVRVIVDGIAGPVVAAPLRTSGRLWGLLCTARTPDRPRFTTTEIDSIADFASRAAIALELAHAREEAQRALLADDRRRIARDLHDHVIQQLFGTGLTLQAIAGGLPPGGDADRLSESIDQLDDAISQIRTVVFALSHRDESSLRHRVIDVVADQSAARRRPPAIRFTGPVDHGIVGPLSDEVVGVVRELLSNAVRHSLADHISVEVALVEESVLVLVEDDGVGIADAERRSGLQNLAERASARGGAFTVASVPGATSARWTVPVRDGAFPTGESQ